MNADKFSHHDVTAVILAGGQASRMGGNDKGLIKLDGKAMIEYVIDRLQPQVAGIVINANRNIEKYAEYGFPVISDEMSGFQGPLAGIASALQNIKTRYLLTTPCDSPFLPDNLVNRLGQELLSHDADISVADSGERLQPVFACMRTGLSDSLREYLENGDRKIDRWYKQHRMTSVDFSDRPETFLNINTPDEIEIFKHRLQQAL